MIPISSWKVNSFLKYFLEVDIISYKVAFSSRLSELRKEHNLSLSALGEILGISNQAVSLIEKGKNAPSFEVLCKFAEHFNVSIDYLVGRTDNPNITL